jgi:selenocysteine lyase/cysteine desulfurase
MVGSMAAAFLPTPSKESPLFGLDREQLSDWMRARGVESWFHVSPSRDSMLVRVSAQLYNTEEQYTRLAGLLAEALRAG